MNLNFTTLFKLSIGLFFFVSLAISGNEPGLEILPRAVSAVEQEGKNILLNLLETVYGGNNEEMFQGFYYNDVASIFC
jgi:hypothetical protein